MFANVHFPDEFSDNGFGTPFGVAGPNRNNTGAGNRYDPESLLSGAEKALGMTYSNSRRSWRDHATYLLAVGGGIPTSQILKIAPRQRLHPPVPGYCGRQQAILGPWGLE